MAKTVLVVEDQPDIRSLTRFIVESIGYNVIEACNGYEAFEEAKSKIPDIILMDIAMPKMNGITSANLIRNSEIGKRIPIVAFTSFGKEFIDVADSFGFDKVVQKPLDQEHMKILLDEYLDPGH
ncbi:MAG: response regulator [Saprospiraceae bacterium]|nr:response regulator [Pyrinomonadaceae bacterium]